MADNRDDLIRLLIEKVESNNNKLDDIKDSYYELKYMAQAHQEVDEKMHKEVIRFMESTSKRLDTYNRQLEIHIEATDVNRKDIAEFKTSVQPIINNFIEDQAVKRAHDKNIAKIKRTVGIIGSIIGIIAAAITLYKSF